MLFDTSTGSVSTMSKIELVDTHAHLNFDDFKNDADEVIRRSLAGSTGSPQVWMINVGAYYSASKRAVEMAEKYEKGVYAAIGLHPIHARGEEFAYEKYKKLALSNSRRVVAVGEIGLDYKIEYVSYKEKQKEVFLEQLGLAEELNLPVILHCRQSHTDLTKILAENSSPRTGVIHCFTGTWREAEAYLKMGLYLGFNGIIFRLNLDEIIEKTPLDRILLETDCPYLTPPPMIGRNEPLYVKYVAEKIAKIKKLSYEEIAERTCQNAKNLFKLN